MQIVSFYQWQKVVRVERCRTRQTSYGPQGEGRTRVLSFDLGAGRRFNYRVVAVFVDEGHVLLHKAESDSFWSLPGGRGEILEGSAATLRREMQEELGQAVTPGRLLWVVENFFRLEGTGERYHEIAFYYQAAFDRPEMYGKGGIWHGHDEAAALTFKWFPIAELSWVPLYPVFLRTALGQLPETTQHVVIDELA